MIPAAALLVAGCAGPPPAEPPPAPPRSGPPLSGRIAYVHEDAAGRRLCVWSPDGGLPCLDGGWYPGPPSPDRARLLLVRDDALAIWEADGTVTPLADGLAGVRAPVWDGDGAIARARIGGVDGLWRLVPGRSPTPLATSPLGDHEAHAAPSGRIAFTSSRRGHADLYLLEDGVPRALTDDPADDLHPRWHPDGATLAFLRNDGGQARVWLWRDGNLAPLSPLPAGVHDLDLAWSPDGTRLALPRMQEGGGAWLSVVDVAGEEQAHVEAAAQHPAWSPDGRWVAYDVRRGDHVAIEVVHRSGVDRHVLVAPADADAWLPRWLAPGITDPPGPPPRRPRDRGTR